MESKLREHYPGYAIQGELCGPSIQKNLLGLKQRVLFVFNVIEVRSRKHLGLAEATAVCEKLGLPRVEFIRAGDSFDIPTIKELLVLSEGKYPKTTNEREGIVVRSADRKISFKVISNKYLIKNDY